MKSLILYFSVWIAKGLTIDIITPRVEDQLGKRVSVGKARLLNVIGLWTHSRGIEWREVDGAAQGIRQICLQTYKIWRLNKAIMKVGRKYGATPGMAPGEILKWIEARLSSSEASGYSNPKPVRVENGKPIYQVETVTQTFRRG